MRLRWQVLAGSGDSINSELSLLTSSTEITESREPFQSGDFLAEWILRSMPRRLGETWPVVSNVTNRFHILTVLDEIVLFPAGPKPKVFGYLLKKIGITSN